MLVACATIAAACSSSEPAATTTTTTTTLAPVTTIATTTTTTTAPTTTTTTTIPAVEVSEAINGLPGDEATIDRRVVSVKIDNHPNARPQSGLDVADAAFEVLVEAGLTRFIALFHQSDADFVGPNRSGRPTDSQIMSAMAGGPFQISGAQGWVQRIFREDDINVVYDNGQTTWRMPDRPRPHNLYTSTLLIREWADERGWPDESPGNLFAYGEPEGYAGAATSVSVAFSDTSFSNWLWDSETEQYVHYQGDELHQWVTDDGDVGPVAFDTVVVMKMRRYIARNPAGSGTSLPTVDTVGSGEAFVFSEGQAMTGTWERTATTDMFRLVDEGGDEIVMPPGRVWICLIPDTETVTWETEAAAQETDSDLWD